jgi:ankyrin repeat protein
MLKFMLKENADIQITDQVGATPLHWAVRGNQVQCMRILIENGCMLDAKTQKGETALHWAATEGEAGLVGCVDVLINAGCDWSLENSYPRPKAMDERAYSKMMEHQGTHAFTALQLAQERQMSKAVLKLAGVEANPPVSERERSEQARTSEQKRKKSVEKSVKKREKRETELAKATEAFQVEQ